MSCELLIWEQILLEQPDSSRSCRRPLLQMHLPQGDSRTSGCNGWWLVVHLVRCSPLLNHPSIQARPAPALIRRRCRRDARQNDPYLRSFARLAVELQPATQTTRDDVVDDLQTEAGASLVATRRQERVERLTLDTETHAAAIVGKSDLDIVLAGRPQPFNDFMAGTTFRVDGGATPTV
jgi:hypothetical protein